LGLYVAVSATGSKSFRFDYRLDGKRETLTIGRYEEGTPSCSQDDLLGMDFGRVVSLADARALHDRARRMVQAGLSPSKVKAEKRTQKEKTDSFGGWVEQYFEFKSDPKSGDEMLADSTLEELYKLNAHDFELALELMKEWRIDRFYIVKAKAFDTATHAKNLS